MRRFAVSFLSFVILFALTLFITPSQASAHCDTLDGPVVTAARKALKKARGKRKKAKTKEEKSKADMEFFEILVKIHREGEGAKYEGIKPAGSVELEIALADKAVEMKKLDEVLNHIQSPENKEIITHLFHKVKEKSNYDVDDVPAGRGFIEVYVVFIHAVEKAIKGTTLDENELHKHSN